MTSEYWKKRAKELEQSHQKPAHETQGNNLEDLMRGLPPSPSSPASDSNGGRKEIDATALMGRMMGNMGQPQGFGFNAPQSPSQAPEPQPSPAPTCYIKEGVAGYRKLQAQTEIPLAMATGPITGVVSREFEYKGARKVYLIKNHTETVDWSNIDHSRIVTLIEVSAPFIGTFLVPESAVVRKQEKTGQQILKG